MDRQLKIKVCGMREAQNIQQVAALSPDYMGFIFYDKSKRYVGDKFSIPEISPDIKKVGVFVDERLDQMLKIADKHKLNTIQLHGNESAYKCQKLKDAGYEVFKVFSIGNVFNFKELIPYEFFVDCFLFDTKGVEHGGNGVSFDWNIMNKYGSDKPFILAGGIGPEHELEVANLKFDFHKLFGIDINSKFEIEPGLKDVTKLQTFINNLKAKKV
ncbi:MAG: phosphoribosylanthranilate isomerase [Cytophagales bacterium]